MNATSGVASLQALVLAGNEHLHGKILIDVANPLDFSQGFPPSLAVCNTDSLGEQIQKAFPDTRVVKALNTMNCAVMVNPGLVSGDHNVFLSGNDPAAKAEVSQHLVEWFEESEGMDLRGDTMALQRLKDASEKAKCDLSMRDAVEINLPFIASDAQGPRHLNYELTREKLEGLVHDIVEGTLKSVEQCCVDAGVQPGEIDRYVQPTLELDNRLLTREVVRLVFDNFRLHERQLALVILDHGLVLAVGRPPDPLPDRGVVVLDRDRRPATAALLLGALLAAAVGCGRNSAQKVQGQITLSGRPVGPGKIFFLPDESKGNEGPQAEGDFGEDGNYELSTHKPGDGALVGHYRVQIVGTTEGVEFGVESTSEQPSVIPLRYADAKVSGLTAEVASGPNTHNFDLRP